MSLRGRRRRGERGPQERRGGKESGSETPVGPQDRQDLPLPPPGPGPEPQRKEAGGTGTREGLTEERPRRSLSEQAAHTSPLWGRREGRAPPPADQVPKHHHGAVDSIQVAKRPPPWGHGNTLSPW